MQRAGPRSILIVEEQAHWHVGHFPVRCAQLATAYTELGYQVDMLTSDGWSRHPEEPQPPFTVRRYRRGVRWLRRWAALGERRFRPQMLTLLMVIEARAAARRMTPEPDAVIVLGWNTDPVVVALTAGTGRGRWLINQFRDPSQLPVWRIGRARHVEARRRARNGCVRIAVASEERCRAWHDVVPYLDPVVAPIAGTRDVPRIADAREPLGLPTEAKVALLFGDGYTKQREVVLDAFGQLGDWTLVMGGAVADDLDPEDGRCPFRFPGIIPNAWRDQLFSAADLVVLSFHRGYRNNSGTLMDAISVGVPVVCSDESSPAEIVAKYHLGPTFTAGDADALADAVRQAPARLDAADLAAAREEHSNRAVARRQLLVLGIVR